MFPIFSSIACLLVMASFALPIGAWAPAVPTGLPLGLRALTPATETLPTWDGTRFDLPWAIDVLYRGPVVAKNLDQKKEGGCGSCGNRSVVSKELVGALPV